MQEENTTKSHFPDKLLKLKEVFKGRQKDMALKLGVTNSYLSEVFNGRQPSLQFQNAVDLLHKNIFSTVEIPSLQKEMHPVLWEAVSGWASKIGLTPSEFFAELIVRYGQVTFDELTISRGSGLTLRELLTSKPDSTSSTSPADPGQDPVKKLVGLAAKSVDQTTQRAIQKNKSEASKGG